MKKKVFNARRLSSQIHVSQEVRRAHEIIQRLDEQYMVNLLEKAEQELRLKMEKPCPS